MISKKIVSSLLVLMSLTLFTVSNAFALDTAQILTKNKLEIGGGLGFYSDPSTTTQTYSATNFSETDTGKTSPSRLGINGIVGYYVTPAIEIAIAPGIGIESITYTGTNNINSNSYTETISNNSIMINIVPTYNFILKDSPIVPYIGPQFGYASVSSTLTYSFSGSNPYAGSYSSSASSVTYGGVAGAKYFISENVVAYLEINLLMYSYTVTQTNSNSVNTSSTTTVSAPTTSYTNFSTGVGIRLFI